jgi:tetratricopeptide (TPR) repeat protein
MYPPHRKRQGGFGKAVLVFSLSLVGVLVIGLALSGVFGGKGDSKQKPVTTAQRVTTTTQTSSSPPPGTVTAPSPVSTQTVKAVPAMKPVETASRERPAGSMMRSVSYAEAEAAYLERDYDGALDLFTAFTEQHPGNAWGHYMFGLSAWKAGYSDDAITGFKDALRIDPKHVKSRLNLARVLLDEGRPGEALPQALEAATLDSTLGEAYRLVGRCRHNLGEPEEAIAAYRKAIALDVNDAWAMNNLGLLLIERGRYQEALPPLAAAVSVKPNTVIFQNNLGIALERTGRYEAAAQAYRNALAVDDANQKVLANLTRVEPIADTPGVVPVDLGELASRFLGGLDDGKSESPALVSTVGKDTEVPD